MVEQASYCRGEGDTVGCHIDNQPCLCLRESWERRVPMLVNKRGRYQSLDVWM